MRRSTSRSRGGRWRAGSILTTTAVLAAGLLMGAAGSAAAAPGTHHARAHRHAHGPTAKHEVWPLGVICSCTGPEASSTSTSEPALRAWASAVNAEGGIDGHRVRIVFADDLTNPGTALSKVKAMVTHDHVLAIFDNSDVDSSFESYVAHHHVPVIGSYADSAAMYTNADFFPNGSTINWLPQSTVWMAKKVHAKRLADLYCAEVAICKQAVEAGKPAIAKAGLKLVYTSGIGFAAPNYTAECLAAQQAGAQAMTVGDASAIVVKVAEDCAAQGYHPVQISADGTVAESWRTTPAMEGNIDVQPDIPFFVHDTPATEAMYRAIRRYQPALAHSKNFGEVVVEAWTSGKLFEAAAHAAKLGNGATPAQVVRGLYALHGETLGGMAPPLTFSRHRPTTDIDCVFVMGIHHQQWTLPQGHRTVCLKR